MVVNSGYLFIFYFLMVGFVCFPSLGCADEELSVVCFIMGVVGFLGLLLSVRLGLWLHIV